MMLFETIFPMNRILTEFGGILGVIFFTIGVIGLLGGFLARRFHGRYLFLLVFGLVLLTTCGIPIDIPYLTDMFGGNDARPAPGH